MIGIKISSNHVAFEASACRTPHNRVVILSAPKDPWSFFIDNEAQAKENRLFDSERLNRVNARRPPSGKHASQHRHD
jgi:hypothetical protein